LPALLYEIPQPIYTADEILNVYVACRAVYFCLLILCTVGNGLNLVVLIRSVPTWKTSACHYMIGTAVADILALWLGLTSFFGDRGVGEDMQNVTAGGVIFVSWVLDVSMNLSDWILVIFSWERLLVIMSPFRFRFLQLVSVARFTIVVLTVLSLALYSFDLAPICCVSLNNPIMSFPAHYPEWYTVWDSINTKGLIAVRILTFLLILIPTVSLIVFLAYHRRSKFGQMRRLQKAASASTSASKSLSQHGINVILLSSALLYLITRTPLFFDLCATAAPQDHAISYITDQSVRNLARPIILVVTLMGYSLNFYVYLLTERQYRGRFIELVARPPLRLWLPKIFHNNSSGQTESVELSARASTQTLVP
ncbi:uncharacterized protein LOC129599037, partial [Paramacrobiotus metropolitanus]|uniref:uncharacterized protein LOC129599037 n=1 Tax=Paramacrobiotus metropolitanus TaxID=2943436 RepID=UPI002445C7EA